jgi:hypothetical protein
MRSWVGWSTLPGPAAEVMLNGSLDRFVVPAIRAQYDRGGRMSPAELRRLAAAAAAPKGSTTFRLVSGGPDDA